MDSVYRDLLIGVIGSVIGALIVYFSSYGLNLTKAARLKYAEKIEKEKSLWRTRKIQVRMEITNNYLFEILKTFLIGSVLTLAPSLLFYIVSIQSSDFEITRYLYGIAAVFNVVGLVYYFAALGKALRYLRIRRTDEDYLNTYLNEEKK
jgi:uncharacterized membrane protein YdjX (TVP38/TMEM64 family)